jgi:hypothetical protein
MDATQPVGMSAIRQAVLLAVGVAAFSALAFFATAHGCSAGDGSFTVTSTDKPSLYCQATGLFPSASTSVYAVLLDLILFASPLVSLLVAGFVCARRGRELSPRVALYACFMAPFTLLLALFADVGFGGPYA